MALASPGIVFCQSTVIGVIAEGDASGCFQDFLWWVSKPAPLGVLLSFCFYFSEAFLQFSVILSCLNGVVLRSTEHFEALVRKHVTIIKSEPYPTKNLLPRNFNQSISNETRTSTNFCYID